MRSAVESCSFARMTSVLVAALVVLVLGVAIGFGLRRVGGTLQRIWVMGGFLSAFVPLLGGIAAQQLWISAFAGAWAGLVFISALTLVLSNQAIAEAAPGRRCVWCEGTGRCPGCQGIGTIGPMRVPCDRCTKDRRSPGPGVCAHCQGTRVNLG